MLHTNTPGVRIDRLHTLMVMLEELAEDEEQAKRFDMTFWLAPELQGRVFPRLPSAFTCGTAACAAGWAASVPTFRRQGLHLEASPPWGVFPVYRGWGGFHALGLFFGISEEDTDALFIGDVMDTPKSVAQRVRKLIEREVA